MNLLEHPKLVAFDHGIYKLEGELRSARKALYEYKTCPREKVTNLLEHPKLVALDGEMHKLEWELHGVREALLELVRRYTRMNQHSNSVADLDGNTKHKEGYEKWDEAAAEAHIEEYESRLQGYERLEQEERAEYVKWLEKSHVTTGDESGSDDDDDDESMGQS